MLVSRVISFTPDLKTNAMGQNWWFLFWHISAVLTYCLLIQEDIDKEGDFCGKVKLKGLTWFHLDSVSLHLSSLIPSSELSCIPDFRWFRDKMRNSFALSRAFIDLWPWMAPYIPGFIIILGTSPLLTVLCQWREWSACHLFFPVIQAPKEMTSYRRRHLPVAAVMKAACPRKSLSIPSPHPWA